MTWTLHVASMSALWLPAKSRPSAQGAQPALVLTLPDSLHAATLDAPAPSPLLLPRPVPPRQQPFLALQGINRASQPQGAELHTINSWNEHTLMQNEHTLMTTCDASECLWRQRGMCLKIKRQRCGIGLLELLIPSCSRTYGGASFCHPREGTQCIVICANVDEGGLLAHDAAQVAALAPVITEDMHTHSMHAIPAKKVCSHP
jgi:hypothetical protein